MNEPIIYQNLQPLVEMVDKLSDTGRLHVRVSNFRDYYRICKSDDCSPCRESGVESLCSELFPGNTAPRITEEELEYVYSHRPHLKLIF